MKIKKLELSVRANNVLAKLGLLTVSELAAFDWLEFAKQPNCGKRTIAEMASQAMKLASGQMLRQAEEWDKKYPPERIDWERLHKAERKARLLDKVVELVTPNKEQKP